VLLSKVLQSIANGVLPGKKEAYMESMNDFISTHIKDAVTFFEKISGLIPEQKIDMERFKVPENALDNALVYLHKHILMCMNKLQAALDADPRGEVREVNIDILRDCIRDQCQPCSRRS
jgi:hypothetical protein